MFKRQFFQIVNVDPIDVERKAGSEDDVPKGKIMILDSKTLRNLDLLGKAGQSMLSVLDKTQTPMGENA